MSTVRRLYFKNRYAPHTNGLLAAPMADASTVAERTRGDAHASFSRPSRKRSRVHTVMDRPMASISLGVAKCFAKDQSGILENLPYAKPGDSRASSGSPSRPSDALRVDALRMDALSYHGWHTLDSKVV